MPPRSKRLSFWMILVAGIVMGAGLATMALTRQEPGLSFGAAIAFAGALTASFAQAFAKGIRW